MNFRPDVRNLGGRKTISDILNNHYSKLDSVKPVVHTRDSPHNFSPVSKSPKSKLRYNSGQDSLTKYDNRRLKNKLNKTLMYEHQVNIKHMQRRIQDIGSVKNIQIHERKKNQFDPISNPVMFFRDDPEDTPGLTPGCIQKLLKPPKTSSIYKDNIRDLQKYRKALTPVAMDGNVELVKSRIFQEIVEKRIYRDEDLNSFFGNAKRVYSKFKPAVVENAINQIKRDFDC